MALRLVGVQQRIRRDALHHLGQLPAEVDPVLDAELKALATDWEMERMDQILETDKGDS
jgi:hypothetical protein